MGTGGGGRPETENGFGPLLMLDEWEKPDRTTRTDRRVGLNDDTVGDLLCATNSPECYLFLSSGGWTAQLYSDHLIGLRPRLRHFP